MVLVQNFLRRLMGRLAWLKLTIVLGPKKMKDLEAAAHRPLEDKDAIVFLE